MIKTIIKRDGREEPFHPEKVNGWGKWAAQELEGRVDWHSVVTAAMRNLPERCKSDQLQKKLIESCLEFENWAYYRMAGRLYATQMRKEIYGLGGAIPTLFEIHKRQHEDGVADPMDYSEDDYAVIETHLDHDKDFEMAMFQLEQLRFKYSIRDRVNGKEYETPQMIYMRMAMALCENYDKANRLEHVIDFYEKSLKTQALSAPTPNYTNLGSNQHSYASCCTYIADDDAHSLSCADHIAYQMTLQSAGIGSMINTRSYGDPVAGGTIKHLGRLGYYRAQAKAITANIRNGRNGAGTTYFSIFDPDAETYIKLRHPLTPADQRVGDLDVCGQSNRLFLRKAAQNEDIFTFNVWSAPDLFEAMYSGDMDRFETLYEKYENDPNFKKKYVNARERLIKMMTGGYETGRAYLSFPDWMNYHTSFKDRIWTSNLCLEALFPTAPYYSVTDLYKEEDHGRGEIGLCNLAAVVVSKIEDDDHYRQVVYHALNMIDYCIHNAEYNLPHLRYTARQRLNAGIGIMGLAELMAMKGIKYDTQEGRDFMHWIAERHAYICIEQSLKLSKERGVAPWMHKTKWPDGWLPIDTYAKTVDDIVEPNYHYDWETLRSQIVENGGIRNSCLINYMPGESSSKAVGTTNSIYPARFPVITKSDQDTKLRWAARDHDLYGDDAYQSAYSLDWKDQINMYAIFQKFTDQACSADMWRKIGGEDYVGTSEMIEIALYLWRMGVKTRYYQNTLMSQKVKAINEYRDENIIPFAKPDQNALYKKDYSEIDFIHDGLAATDNTLSEENEVLVESTNGPVCEGGSCSL